MKFAALRLDTRKLDQCNLVAMAHISLKQVATKDRADLLSSPAAFIFDFGYDVKLSLDCPKANSIWKGDSPGLFTWLI